MNVFPTAIANVSDAIKVQREWTRVWIAGSVVGLLVVYSILILIYMWNRGASDIDKLISGVFTPIVGIVGTVLGFYFGSQSKGDPS